MSTTGTISGGWTFLTNHAHTLVCLARRPDALLREVAVEVGITERAVHNIVSDLEGSGVLRRRRDGRRNHYEIDPEKALRHPVEAHCTIGQLLEMVLDVPAKSRARRGSAAGGRKRPPRL